MDFPFYPDGYVPGHNWRPLRRQDAMQKGWDVVEWQSRLTRLGYVVVVDGWFGNKTSAATRKFQETKLLVVDGIAGVATQVKSGLAVAQASDLPDRVHGQLEKESSLLCGIYTPPYADGSRDRGPTQQNSNYWKNDAEAFDVRVCVPALVAHIKANYKRYKDAGVPEARAWAAAQGAWNSPKYANRYAFNEPVPDSFLRYIDAVTAYVA